MACVLAQTMKVVESWTAVAGQAKKRICISFSCPETLRAVVTLLVLI